MLSDLPVVPLHHQCSLAVPSVPWEPLPERSSRGLTDTERAAKALKGITGKRLTYQRTHTGA